MSIVLFVILRHFLVAHAIYPRVDSPTCRVLMTRPAILGHREDIRSTESEGKGAEGTGGERREGGHLSALKHASIDDRLDAMA
jgi:hypothetical protein